MLARRAVNWPSGRRTRRDPRLVMFEIAFGWPRAPDAPDLARADAGRALLAILRTVTGQILRTVTGQGDRAPWSWTGSWTELSVPTVRSGPWAARLRGIRAGSAGDAPGRTSHNPPVVGSSPTRPTSPLLSTSSGMTRHRAYQAQLSGQPIGETFSRATAFLLLAAEGSSLSRSCL